MFSTGASKIILISVLNCLKNSGSGQCDGRQVRFILLFCNGQPFIRIRPNMKNLLRNELKISLGCKSELHEYTLYSCL